MKNSRYYLIAAVIALAISCKEVGRIDQPDNSKDIPEKVSITGTTSIPGGAIIKYEIPDDEHLRGVKVVYERNGELSESVSSRYVDSLVVEGFGDTNEHVAKVYSIGFNDMLSEPIDVTITPELPTIRQVQLSLREVYGGVSVHLSGNEIGSSLAVVLIQDTLLTDEGKIPSEIEWEDVYTFHTNLDNQNFPRRGMVSETKLFGAYVRDRWGNCSDTVYCKLTPLEEYELPRTGVWKIITLPGDWTAINENNPSWYSFDKLFDGSTARQRALGFAQGSREKMITIDMGYVARFSRHQLLQRGNVAEVDSQWSPWHWQIWGSMEPNLDGSMDDSWYLLGDFVQYKPSGVLPDGSGPGTFTAEDTEWIRTVNEYSFDVTEQIPDPQRPCRYFRLKVLDNCESYFTIYDEEPTNIGYMIGELILYGSKVETTE